MAMNLELSHGRHGASARVEIDEGQDGAVGRVSVRGWIESVALRRLEETLDDLSARRMRRLLFDCSQLRHIDFRLVPVLVQLLRRFESGAGEYAVCGLSPHLRDLFRLAGCEPGRQCASPEELPSSWRNHGPSREWAS
jgi:anti-anti-sigma factor